MKNGTRKRRKGLIFTVIMLSIIIVLGLVAGGIWVYGTYIQEETDSVEDYFISLSEEYSEISYDEKKKIPYINNEIIIIAAEDASYEDIQAIASKYDGFIAESLSDIGVYKIRLNDSEKYNDLQKLADKITNEAAVENAFVSTVTLLEEDLTDEEPELPKKKAVYPDDPWYDEKNNEADWNETPDGTNWGLEAVNAPEAWGYLDDISSVKVGLIDSMVDLSHDDIKISSAYAAFTDTSTGKTTSSAITNAKYTADEHGTHVAGIMNATWNDTGISGILGDKGETCYAVAYNVNDGTIINEYTTPYNYFRAIKLLVDNGVRAVNISQNTNRVICFAASKGNKDAIKYLEEQAKQAEILLSKYIESRIKEGLPDFVVCVAAGNVNGYSYVKSDTAAYGWVSYNPKENASHIYLTPESGGALAEYNNYLSLITAENVAKRIIVVGSVGNSGNGNFTYSYFSNVGDRVDIVAPGQNILSLIPNNSTKSLNGTSMSTPHVTAACGMIFGANPSLTGPEVKRIVTSSVNGRYYHGSDYSGLLDLNQCVRNALMTKENSVNTVIKTGYSGLDVCFVIDTTGSMSDDIDDAKSNMTSIVNSLDGKTPDFRVAIVDYRDFPDRSDESEDYASRTQLEFTSDVDAIRSGINSLTLGNGGDYSETVYSGLAEALKLSWRDDARKVIILLGDAPPLDPEPTTGYTYEQIQLMLYSADLYIETQYSDDRVLGDGEDSLINVYSIGTSASDDAADFFESLSDATGGTYRETEDAAEVSDAIVDSIDEIDISLLSSIVDFGEENSLETVKLTDENGDSFTFPLSESGRFTLSEMEAGEYTWEIERLGKKGEVRLSKSSRIVEAKEDNEWYSFILVLFKRHTVPTILVSVGAVILIVLVIVISVLIKKKVKMKKAQKAEKMHNMPEKQPVNAPNMQKNAAQVNAHSYIKPEPLSYVKPDNNFVKPENNYTPPATSNKVSEPEFRFCGYCGARLKNNEIFCGNCGKKS